MNNLDRRIERLERQISVKRGQRIIYITNLGPDEDKEDPWMVKLSGGLWAHVHGEPLTPEEACALKEKYKEERDPK